MKSCWIPTYASCFFFLVQLTCSRCPSHARRALSFFFSVALLRSACVCAVGVWYVHRSRAFLCVESHRRRFPRTAPWPWERLQSPRTASCWHIQLPSLVQIGKPSKFGYVNGQRLAPPFLTLLSSLPPSVLPSFLLPSFPSSLHSSLSLHHLLFLPSFLPPSLPPSLPFFLPSLLPHSPRV